MFDYKFSLESPLYYYMIVITDTVSMSEQTNVSISTREFCRKSEMFLARDTYSVTVSHQGIDLNDCVGEEKS